MAANRKLTKNEKRRLRQKEQGGENNNAIGNNNVLSSQITNNDDRDDDIDDLQIEYVSAEYSEDSAGVDKSVLEQFKDIFTKFAKPEDLLAFSKNTTDNDDANSKVAQIIDDVKKESTIVKSDEPKKLSKKKKKLMSRLSVAELKQLVPRPDVVEAHDVTSQDPRLLVFIKAYRNTVPIPRHWCHKRKYLQGIFIYIIFLQ